jgi:hypothetical protein
MIKSKSKGEYPDNNSYLWELLRGEYLEELYSRVSSSDLFLSKRFLWEHVICLVSYRDLPSSVNVDKAIYEEKVEHYRQKVTGQPQHSFNIFMAEIADRMNGYGGYVLAEWNIGMESVEGYMEKFGVDRDKALKMKSLYEDSPLIEMEWKQIK